MYKVALFSKTINAFEKISSTYFLWTNMQIKTFRPLKTIYHRDCTVITPTIVPGNSNIIISVVTLYRGKNVTAGFYILIM